MPAQNEKEDKTMYAERLSDLGFPSKTENDDLQSEVHAFLSTTAGQGKVTLDADTEDLVETYYKKGYVLSEKYFDKAEKPKAVSDEGWDSRKPTPEERGYMSHLRNGLMWEMTRKT